MTSGLTSAQGTVLTRIVPGSSRRGACPTLRAPMQTGDGLLARIRVAGASMTPGQLSRLGHLAQRHGNGLVEITARGNLQVRGLSEASAAPFADAVAALLPIETGLVVDLSPLAGLDPDELADPRPLAEAIRHGAASWADRLGPKVSVVIDSGGQVSLASLKADIGLRALPDRRWAVTLGGGKPQMTDAEGAVAATLALLGALAAIGPEARATDLFPPPQGTNSTRRETEWGTGRFRLVRGHATPIALPFGSARSADLVALDEAASGAGVETLRLTPGHVLLIDNATDTLIGRAAALGFITRSDDPRRRISACIGNRGCASGLIAAREIAGRLAPNLSPDRHLHVSGCAKGCAHPGPTDVTLVGTPDGIGLVIAGRAGDMPEQFLDEAELADALVPHQGRR